MLIPPPCVLDEGEYNACGFLQTTLIDVKFLARESEKLAKNIDQVMKLVKDQMELSQSFWSTMLVFVVAIYVPISFASVSTSNIVCIPVG